MAYEKALIGNGIDAASVYMTPKKLSDMREMQQTFGEAAFQEFRNRMRAAATGEARRKQIEKVVLQGDRATLTARTGPNFVDEVHFVRTKGDWKIGIRGE